MEAAVGGHLDQAVAKSCRGDARYQAPEGAASASPGRPIPRPFPSLSPGVSEVEILDDDRPAAAGVSQREQLTDRCPHATVAGRCRKAGEREGNRHRRIDRVARGIDDNGSQVIGIHVHGQNRPLPQFVEPRAAAVGRLPGGVDMPAPLRRITGDVVADCRRGRLCGHLVASVGEDDRTREPVPIRWPIGERGQRSRKLDLQPALVGMPADRLVPPRFVGLAVGADEQPRGLPPCAPLLVGQARLAQVVAHTGEPPPTPTDGQPPFGHPGLGIGQSRTEHLEPALLLEPLGRTLVAARPPTTFPDGDDQTPPDPADPGPQAPDLGREVAAGELPDILARPGDRPRPPRRASSSQRPLALPSRHRATLGIQATFPAAPREVAPGQGSERSSQGTQHVGVMVIDQQPCAHPGARRRSDVERRGRRTKATPRHRIASGLLVGV
jgi:hypothetical protein